MLFTKGQKIFALVFLIAFTITMIWAYRSEAKRYKQYFKNVWVVLISLILVLGAVVLLIKILNKYSP